MSVLNIIEWPHQTLETCSPEVTDFNEEIKTFVRSMHETMDHDRGIGLAANQVNELKRIMVIHIPHLSEPEEGEEAEELRPWHNKRYTFVNPVITQKKGKCRGVEGCLSFPGVFEFVERYAEVTVRAQDENGNFFEVEADGLFAICIQHEIDHLDGIVFFRRMSRLKASSVKKRMQKRALMALKGEREHA